MRTASPRLLWTALIFYIAVSLGYQIVASVSLIVGYFNLRRQVDQPFDPGYTHRRISSVSPLASKAGLQVGDTLETLNGVPFAGRAQWQEARFFAHPGDRWHVRVRKPSGQELDFTIPLEPELETFSWGEAIFLLVVQLLVPLICLALGYWVALARPADPNAWFILILLSFPEAFISISTYNWLPGPWLVLRLFWQTALQVLAPAAMLWLGLLFLERSRIDVRAPWLKWVVLAVQLAGLGIEFAAQYSGWYDQSFFVNRQAIESFTDSTLNWMTLLCIAVYWCTLFEKLTTRCHAGRQTPLTGADRGLYRRFSQHADRLGLAAPFRNRSRRRARACLSRRYLAAHLSVQPRLRGHRATRHGCPPLDPFGHALCGGSHHPDLPGGHRSLHSLFPFHPSGAPAEKAGSLIDRPHSGRRCAHPALCGEKGCQ